MTTLQPKIASQSEWLAARKTLLQKEKELTRARDALSAELRQLPMVKLDKEYKFHGPNGSILTLDDLFDGKDQLIVYHFMFGPDAEKGCNGCACVGEHIPDLRHLRSRNTNMVVVSRAPFEKLDVWKKKIGWTFPWYSSHGSDFNFDFHVTMDPAVRPVEYNFASAAELEAKGLKWHLGGEQPGLSVFFRKDGVVYHTYSTYARGSEQLIGTYMLLDMTPLGRQDGMMGPAEFKLRYEYGDDA
ncbi:hypothetical protein QBC34DRAFT_484896 [Podospora aff. communis PSN243]|uniref:Thioredoxin domain-containing protein n=1 Tax=Podospora aff. communis PSN243 TaxID=3040156 RepID=A0AAV9GMV7_9PEZI|nr:hypothetical protein QBC34DRAFT_484896 [Podospora aff. communis PSN243]